METIQIKVFSIDELQPGAKKRAIENHREINIYQGWADPIEEGAREDLKTRGYIDPKIMFSGFGSQGDGACFTAKIAIGQWLTAHKLNAKYKALKDQAECFGFEITHHWRYFFSTSTTVEFVTFYEPEAEADKQAHEVLELIKKEREAIGDRLYRDLEKYWFELMEDEAVMETIRINEFQFFEDGRQFVPVTRLAQ